MQMTTHPTNPLGINTNMDLHKHRKQIQCRIVYVGNTVDIQPDYLYKHILGSYIAMKLRMRYKAMNF